MEIKRRDTVPDALQNDAFLIATNYWHSCMALMGDPRGDEYRFINTPALNLLLGFCLELSFKAVLQARGASDQELKHLGHDLLKGYRAARDAGYVAPTPELWTVTQAMAKGHHQLWWRYLPTRKEVPSVVPRTVMPIVGAHLDHLASFLGVSQLPPDPPESWREIARSEFKARP